MQSERVTKLKKPEEYDDLFIPIITATISYGLATLGTLEGITPRIQADIDKALVKLGGATLEALLTEILNDADKFTTPFGAADVGISVLVGIIEGFAKYSEQIEYYHDDGLPEDIAKKEAILDAVSGGLHDAMIRTSRFMAGMVTTQSVLARTRKPIQSLAATARIISIPQARTAHFMAVRTQTSSLSLATRT